MKETLARLVKDGLKRAENKERGKGGRCNVGEGRGCLD